MMKPSAMQEGKQGMPAAGTAVAQPQGKSNGMETYRRLVLAAMKLIYTKEITNNLMELMRASTENPVEGVAQAVSTVMGLLSEKTKGLNPKAVYAVTPPVSVFVMELGGSAKLFKPSPEMLQQVIQMVGKQAVGQQAKPQQAPAQQAPAQGIVQSQIQPQAAGV